MTVLTLRNVPESLVEQLKQEAKRNRRSLNQEALLRLERSVAGRRRAAEETLASLRRFHRRVAYLAPLTDRFLERAKREGRP